MGSPNFNTNLDHPSYAIDFNDTNEYDDEGEFISGYDEWDVRDMFDAAKEVAEQLTAQSFATSVKVESGYHSGFQIIVEDEFEITDSTVEELEENYSHNSNHPMFFASDHKGYEFHFDEGLEHPVQRYFARKLKANWHEETNTFVSNAVALKCLEEIIDYERTLINKKLEELAKEIGLGIIVGRTWTSSVNYDIESMAA